MERKQSAQRTSTHILFRLAPRSEAEQNMATKLTPSLGIHIEVTPSAKTRAPYAIGAEDIGVDQVTLY